MNEPPHATSASSLIVVGIPAFNEERTIAKIILRATKHARKIIVVDDGSTDDTAMIAEGLGAGVTSHGRNLGKGHALKTIFETARELGAEVLVTIDADAQHDPDEIPIVAEPILDGTADVVVGARTTGPRFRWLGQKALDIATAVRDKDGVVVDSQSGFRAYSKKAIDTMDFGERGMGTESESLKMASEKGLIIKQVPIKILYKGETDHTLHPVLHFSDVLSTLAKITFLKRPLRFLGVPAVLLVLYGLFRWIQILNAYNTTKEFAIGNALVASVVLISGFFLGIGAIILLAIRLIVQEGQ